MRGVWHAPQVGIQLQELTITLVVVATVWRRFLISKPISSSPDAPSRMLPWSAGSRLRPGSERIVDDDSVRFSDLGSRHPAHTHVKSPCDINAWRGRSLATKCPLVSPSLIANRRTAHRVENEPLHMRLIIKHVIERAGYHIKRLLLRRDSEARLPPPIGCPGGHRRG